MEQNKGIPLTQIQGIGPARAKKLAKLGLEHLDDLLGHFPQRYEDRRSKIGSGRSCGKQCGVQLY